MPIQYEKYQHGADVADLRVALGHPYAEAKCSASGDAERLRTFCQILCNFESNFTFENNVYTIIIFI